MPTYSSSQEWLEQSSLLLKARPSTTRITTAYSIKTAKPRHAKTSEEGGADAPMPDAPASKPPRGRLVIKTFDPASGVTLRYKTHKAAEVSRLILSLGRLGRGMAALPETSEEDMIDAPAGGGKEDEAAEGKLSAGQPVQPQQQQQQGQAQGGAGKKKKKGKK